MNKVKFMKTIFWKLKNKRIIHPSKNLKICLIKDIKPNYCISEIKYGRVAMDAALPSF